MSSLDFFRKQWGILSALAVLVLAAGVANCEITTVTYQVSASADDGFASSSTIQDISGWYLYIGTKGTDYTAPFPMSAMRFTNVQIPARARIIEAHLKICSGEYATHGRVYGVIQAEAADNPGDFGSRNIATLTKTIAAVNWDHLKDWAHNSWYASSDVANVVQEVINRTGWSPGNSTAIIYSTRDRTSFFRWFSSWDRGAEFAPRLEITYEFYRISGHITASDGSGAEGVAVSAGSGVKSTTTDSSGYYELAVPPGWSGTVSVGKAGWGFNPASRTYNNVTGNQTNQDYTAFQPKISGYIRDAEGSGAEGVLVSADNGGGVDTTGPDGYYTIVVPYDWSGTVTPNKWGWGFNPGSRPYSNVTSDQANQDYTAFQPKISGRVMETDGNGAESVVVSADNGGGADTTGPDGNYTIVVPYSWSGTVTPNKWGWGFSPANRSYENVTVDEPNQDYAAFQPKISGRVTDTNGVGLGGVMVSADNGGGSDTTDGTGHYELTVPYSWSGTVTPSKSGWGFSPANRSYINVISDKTNQDYTAFQPKISGYVTDANGGGMEGVPVSADSGGGADTTDPNGYYSIVVPYDWSGTVTPSKTGWGFNPASRSYENVIADQVNQDYTAFQPMISGYITDANGGGGIEGVLVSADSNGGVDTTGPDGYYTIVVLYGWSGTVTPSKSGWGFSPASRSYGNVIADQASQDYTAFQPRISGYVTDTNAVGADGVMVSADNGGGADTTGPDGYYDIIVPYDWSGTVTPSKSGWGFSPASRSYENVIADEPNQDYTAFQPKISGHVADGDGNSVEGVLVSADSNGGSDTTGSDGYYEVIVPYGWSGTVTPAKTWWAFDPNERVYENVTTDQADQDYTAFAPPVISGYVTDGTGIGVEGVLLVADNNGGSDTTDANGYYELTVPQGWSGTVTAEKSFWFFEPPSLSYENLTEDISNQDYSATAGVKISGYVSTGWGGGVEGVQVSADNGGGFDSTDSNGFYQLAVLPNWSGTLTPSNGGRLFVPTSRSYTNLTADLTAQNFVLLGLTVRADGTGDYPTIQAAVDAAFNRDEVTVEPGTYTGPGNSEIDFNGKAVVLHSIDPNDPVVVAATIVDCNEAGFGFDFRNFEDANSVVDGLTITGASWGGGIRLDKSSPTIRNCIIRDNEGAGILGYYDTSLVISNCIITGNIGGEWGGGGIRLGGGGENVTISDCIISDNHSYWGGGGISVYLEFRDELPPTMSISNCIITGNSGDYAGGVLVYNGTISNCIISNNNSDEFGGGLYCGGACTVTNCSITDNIAEAFGGGIYLGDRAGVTITDSTISGNWAREGGGIYYGYFYYPYGISTLANCNIVANTAAQRGGGIYCSKEANPTITNCNIAGNTAGDFGGGIFCNFISGPAINKCTISDNSAGTAGGGIFGWRTEEFPEISNCLFSGNSAEDGGAVADCHGPITNCTIVGNSADYGSVISHCFGPLSNCIIWDNTTPALDSRTRAIYSCIQNLPDGGWGWGNIDADPCFAVPGRWVDANDPNTLVEPNDPNAIWIDGDYHLKSEAGRWSPSIYAKLDPTGDGFINLVDFAAFAGSWREKGGFIPADLDRSGVVNFFDLTLLLDNYLMSYNPGVWVIDDVTSSCIDAGDPNSDWTAELWPHGKCTNMGAYGGAPEASMSLSSIGNVADVNVDDAVNFRDFAHFADSWEIEEVLLAQDFDRNGIVDSNDLEIFADNWLWEP